MNFYKGTSPRFEQTKQAELKIERERLQQTKNHERELEQERETKKEPR